MVVPILGGGLTTWEKFPRKVVFFWSVSLIQVYSIVNFALRILSIFLGRADLFFFLRGVHPCNLSVCEQSIIDQLQSVVKTLQANKPLAAIVRISEIKF